MTTTSGPVPDKPQERGRARYDVAEDEEPDPRWSLANERTLLAYNRTALALLVAGIAVSGSRTVVDAPISLAVLGLPLMVLSAVISGISSRRFFAVQRAMRRGEPLPMPSAAKFLPLGVAVIAALAVVAAAVEVFVIS